MCGISGWLNLDQQPVDHVSLQRMTDSLIHRGPDGEGFEYPVPWVGLGHRRLSIIDLETGRQPISNEDATVWITYNGEIFNYRELRSELISKGHQFKTQSDTEVIVHLYEEEGEHCVDRLNGQFAFALWDGRQLFCARDPLGLKPFYYYQDSTRFLFASEPRAIVTGLGSAPEIDVNGVLLYMRYRFLPAPATALKGLRKLRAGEWLTLDTSGKLATKQYWSVSRETVESLNDPAAAQERISNELTSAINRQMIADVPVGAFLSGGLDSSTVVALMKEQSPDPISTFSLGFPESKYDERAFASEVSRCVGTNHIEQILDPEAAGKMIPGILDHMDEPFGDPSILPTFAVASLAREKVKVVLSGDGGDELFAGYDRYFRVLSVLTVPPLLRPFWKRFRRRFSHGRDPLAWTYPDRGEVNDLHHHEYLETSHRSQKRLQGDRIRDAIQRGIDDPVDQVFDRVASFPPLARLLAVDLQTILADYHLVKVDRASMQTSLEVRVPLLDTQFVKLAFQLSPTTRLYGAQSKGMIREIARSRLPASVINREKKGFGPPFRHWFGKELSALAHERLSDSHAVKEGLLNRKGVQRLLTPDRKGETKGPLLWRILALEAWIRNLSR